MGLLRGTVDRHSSVDLEDMKPLKRSLGSLGFYKTPKIGLHEYPDENLFNGIEKFQKKEGLQVDGVMKPGGPTENRLLQKVAEKGSKSSNSRDGAVDLPPIDWPPIKSDDLPGSVKPNGLDPYGAWSKPFRWGAGKLEQINPTKQIIQDRVWPGGLRG